MQGNGKAERMRARRRAKPKPKATVKIGSRHVVLTPPYRTKRYKPRKYNWIRLSRQIEQANERGKRAHYVLASCTTTTQKLFETIFGKGIIPFTPKGEDTKGPKIKPEIAKQFLKMPPEEATSVKEIISMYEKQSRTEIAGEREG